MGRFRGGHGRLRKKPRLAERVAKARFVIAWFNLTRDEHAEPASADGAEQRVDAPDIDAVERGVSTTGVRHPSTGEIGLVCRGCTGFAFSRGVVGVRSTAGCGRFTGAGLGRTLDRPHGKGECKECTTGFRS